MLHECMEIANFRLARGAREVARRISESLPQQISPWPFGHPIWVAPPLPVEVEKVKRSGGVVQWFQARHRSHRLHVLRSTC